MSQDPTEARPGSAPPPAGGFGAQDGASPHPHHPMPPPPVAATSKGMPTWAIALIATVFGGVFVIGILAALAISGVNKFLRAAKAAEAKNSIGMMSKDAVAAFEAADLASDAGPSAHSKLCGSATAPVPVGLALISGKKYQSAPADWELDKEAHKGFACLDFRMDSPQYYQYDYKSDGDSYTAIARGDLDGNGVYSEFKFGGHVVNGAIIVDGRIEETNPEE